MSTKTSTLLSFFLTVSLASTVYADSKTEKIGFDQSTGSMAFHAVGRPSALKINGTGASPKGSVTWSSAGKASGDLTLDLTTLDTGIAMRTNHMKEKYLEVTKYPQAKLTLTDVALPAADFGKDFSESSVPFKGDLLLHGVTKPVSGTAKIEQHGASTTIHAEFSVKITDYSIPVPVFAGITVADDVSLVIDATAPVTQSVAAPATSTQAPPSAH